MQLQKHEHTDYSQDLRNLQLNLSSYHHPQLQRVEFEQTGYACAQSLTLQIQTGCEDEASSFCGDARNALQWSTANGDCPREKAPGLEHLLDRIAYQQHQALAAQSALTKAVPVPSQLEALLQRMGLQEYEQTGYAS